MPKKKANSNSESAAAEGVISLTLDLMEQPQFRKDNMLAALTQITEAAQPLPDAVQQFLEALLAQVLVRRSWKSAMTSEKNSGARTTVHVTLACGSYIEVLTNAVRARTSPARARIRVRSACARALRCFTGDRSGRG